MTEDCTSSALLQPLVAVSGRDTDTAIASLAGMYAGKAWYSRPIDQDYWYKYVAVGDEQLSIRRSQMHGYLRGDVAVEGEIVVQWLEQGRARVDVGRDEIQMRPGVPTMFPAARRFEMEYEDWDQRLVHLSRDLVLDVASENYVVDGSLAFQPAAAQDDAGAVARWRGAVADAMRVLRESGADSLPWHEAQRDVARALLQLYPLQADLFPIGSTRTSRRRLRTAIEYIQTHAQEPLTVVDIARACDLSVRGVQETFQRSLGTTPMGYLRDTRLRRTHEELQAAEQHDGVFVAAVAERWGFHHMGRFSAAYAAEFGEYPRQTLRAARALVR